MVKDNSSVDSMIEATRSRAKFSGHGGALGAAGYREASNNPDNCEFLTQPGQSIAVNVGKITSKFNNPGFSASSSKNL